MPEPEPAKGLLCLNLDMRLVRVVSRAERVFVGTDLSAVRPMMPVMPVMPVMGRTAAFPAKLTACAACDMMLAMSAFLGLTKNVLVAEFAAS